MVLGALLGRHAARGGDDLFSRLVGGAEVAPGGVISHLGGRRALGRAGFGADEDKARREPRPLDGEEQSEPGSEALGDEGGPEDAQLLREAEQIARHFPGGVGAGGAGGSAVAPKFGGEDAAALLNDGNKMPPDPDRIPQPRNEDEGRAVA